jgi:hypothetical protein
VVSPAPAYNGAGLRALLVRCGPSASHGGRDTATQVIADADLTELWLPEASHGPSSRPMACLLSRLLG